MTQMYDCKEKTDFIIIIKDANDCVMKEKSTVTVKIIKS